MRTARKSYIASADRLMAHISDCALNDGHNTVFFKSSQMSDQKFGKSFFMRGFNRFSFYKSHSTWRIGWVSFIA